MGQKTHPLSLRIQSSTRSFDNTWYSDHFFTKLISIDVWTSLYFHTFFKHFKLPFARFSLQHTPKTSKVYTFFCYPRQSRESHSKIFQIPSGLSHITFSSKGKTLKKQKQNQLQKQQMLVKNSIKDKILWQHGINPYRVSSNEKSPLGFPCDKREISLLSKFHQIFLKNKDESNLSGLERAKNIKTFKHHSLKRVISLESLKKLLLRKSENRDFPLTDIKHLASNFYMMEQQNTLKKLETAISLNFSNIFQHGNQPMEFKYKNHVQNSLSHHFQTNVKFFPFKVNHEWQDAGFFADEIVYLLERRIPFRRLKNRLFKQLALNRTIKGLRVTCSGRVGGKSKKAQRAKMDSIKYGQTSLHVFSSKIDFATRTAQTPLGSTGIKVWICYK